MTRSNPRIDLYQHQPCHFLDFLLLLVWPHTECWLNLNMPLHGVSHSCNGWLVTCGLPYSIRTFLRFVSSLSLPFFLNGKTEAFRAWESCMQQLAYLWYASLSFSLTGERQRLPHCTDCLEAQPKGPVSWALLRSCSLGWGCRKREFWSADRCEPHFSIFLSRFYSHIHVLGHRGD